MGGILLIPVKRNADFPNCEVAAGRNMYTILDITFTYGTCPFSNRGIFNHGIYRSQQAGF
jgi:hypothetical protein